MLQELVIRFVLGGLVVSAFSIAGELFTPKRFAGIFGAAPSVAIASLALAFGKNGRDYVAIEGRSLAIGAVAMLVYSIACVIVAKREGVPVWLGSILSLSAWFAVALVGWGIAGQAGVLR